MLAEEGKERQAVLDRLIPGSKPQLYLEFLETLKRAQTEGAKLPSELAARIKDYQKQHGSEELLVLRELLLRYDRSDAKEQKKILTELNKNYLYFSTTWDRFNPPPAKKVLGQEAPAGTRYKSELQPDALPTRKQLVEKLHKSHSSFENVHGALLPLVDFGKLNQNAMNQFMMRRSHDVPLLGDNKTFLPALANMLDKQCHKNKNYYSEANRAFLEALTLKQLNGLASHARFLEKEDRNFVGVCFSKRFADWLALDN